MAEKVISVGPSDILGNPTEVRMSGKKYGVVDDDSRHQIYQLIFTRDNSKLYPAYLAHIKGQIDFEAELAELGSLIDNLIEAKVIDWKQRIEKASDDFIVNNNISR